jgi:hypothetical protein
LHLVLRCAQRKTTPPPRFRDVNLPPPSCQRSSGSTVGSRGAQGVGFAPRLSVYSSALTSGGPGGDSLPTVRSCHSRHETPPQKTAFAVPQLGGAGSGYGDDGPRWLPPMPAVSPPDRQSSPCRETCPWRGARRPPVRTARRSAGAVSRLGSMRAFFSVRASTLALRGLCRSPEFWYAGKGHEWSVEVG